MGSSSPLGAVAAIALVVVVDEGTFARAASRLGFTQSSISQHDVESVKLLDDPYVLVARPDEFADGMVRLVDVGERAVVAWPATCDQPRMEHALRVAGPRPRVVFRSASNEALLGMVRAGLGIAFLPKLAVSNSLTPLAARAAALAQEIAATM